MKKFATTFGSSTIKSDEKEYKEGYLIGSELAKKGYILQCGGYQGLMEAVAKGAKEADGECIGHCIEFFEKSRPKNPYLTQKIIHRDILDRLRALIDNSSIFIVQDGSLGTLNELIMVWTLAYIKVKESIRICIVGKDNWQEVKKLKIDKELFEYLEFFDDAKSFLESVE